MTCFYETRVKPIINSLLFPAVWCWFNLWKKSVLYIKLVSSDSSVEEESMHVYHGRNCSPGNCPLPFVYQRESYDYSA